MVSASYETSSNVPGVSANIWGVFWFLLLAAGGAVFFWEGIAALLEAWQQPEYSHGPLIPVLSSLLFLRHLKAVPVQTEPVRDVWPGVVLFGLAIALGILGKVSGINDVVAYAMIGFIGSLVLLGMGWKRGFPFWPAVLHLVFMLPLPATLYWKLSTFLQLVSSEFGVWMIQMMAIPVYLDGNIIDLGVYKLHVAEACSGLRYLFPIMSFSYVFATLYQGPAWHKAVLLISAAPLAVLMNSIRIGVIGIVVNSYGLAHVEGITHLLEGWVIFVTCVVLLFGLARIMMMMQGTRMTLAEALDLDVSGLLPHAMRVRSVDASGGLIACALTITALAGGWQLLPDRDRAPIERESLSLMPLTIGDWRQVRTQVLDPRVERELGADDYIGAVYAPDTAAPTAEIFIAWYQDQTNGGIHSPEVCLPGGGWEMAEIIRTDIGHVVGQPGDLPINRAIIQKGEERLLVYYWFEQYGGRTASDFLAKLALLKNAALYGRTDGALVRILTPLPQGESIAAAEARLESLVAPLMGKLDAFVPRRQAN